jgi:excinuclease UvrABC ATPase subunit
MRPGCSGTGVQVRLDHGKFFDTSRSLGDGAILHKDFAVDGWYWNVYAQSGRFDLDKPLRDYSDTEWRLLLGGTDEKVAVKTAGRKAVNTDLEGVETKFHRLYVHIDDPSEGKRATVARYTTSVRCADCDGTRLAEAPRTATVGRHTLPSLLARDLGSLLTLLPTLRDEGVGPLVDEAAARIGAPDVRRRLQAVVDVGLGYLTLGQPLPTLSGGECQRLKLAGRLHEEGNVYVLDEPTTGLHMSDCGHLLALPDRLVDGGSSVIVVEHNLDVVAHADWVVDLGPDGGDAGGRVVFEGTPAELVAAPGSATGEHLARRAARADVPG